MIDAAALVQSGLLALAGFGVLRFVLLVDKIEKRVEELEQCCGAKRRRRKP